MTERIRVDNFLVVKKADLELKKINVLIGSQASGKSVIAKLCYFFRTTSNHFIDGVKSQLSKRDLDKGILNEFEMRFPRYAWEGTKFSIRYEIDNLSFEIAGVKNSKGKTTLSLTYIDTLSTLYNRKKKLYKKKVEEAKSEQKYPRRALNIESRVLYECILEPLKEGEFSAFFSSSVFIPASRSFFAILQKNIFTFMASNLDIDPFLKDFGSLYESSKRWYKDSLLRDKNNKLSKILDKSISAIIDGEYEYEDEQDWIVSNGRRVNLVNASSGQQESLPMLLVLSVWPLIRIGEKGSLFFIEEPEAHLFPTSQSHIVSMLSHLYSELDVGFFLTSHSPYVLSALNNHILASEVVDAGKLTAKEYTSLNGTGVPIRFDDVASYTISKGITSSLSDEEFKMIGADMLDNVSEHFGEVTNKLLELNG